MPPAADPQAAATKGEAGLVDPLLVAHGRAVLRKAVPELDLGAVGPDGVEVGVEALVTVAGERSRVLEGITVVISRCWLDGAGKPGLLAGAVAGPELNLVAVRADVVEVGVQAPPACCVYPVSPRVIVTASVAIPRLLARVVAGPELNLRAVIPDGVEIGVEALVVVVAVNNVCAHKLSFGESAGWTANDAELG